ncbi:hypothetical protein BG005_007691 [Podila minutissima]|nr:hypothetical protein BG005_007691 [Podila minutissima]
MPQGTVNAMQDAITLANWFNVMPPTVTVADFEKVFEEYQQERYPLAIKAFEASQLMSKMISMNMTRKIFRFVSKHTPSWLQKIALTKTLANRPQVAFLPQAEDTDTVKALAQPSLIKTSYHRRPVSV